MFIRIKLKSVRRKLPVFLHQSGLQAAAVVSMWSSPH